MYDTPQDIGMKTCVKEYKFWKLQHLQILSSCKHVSDQRESERHQKDINPNIPEKTLSFATRTLSIYLVFNLQPNELCTNQFLFKRYFACQYKKPFVIALRAFDVSKKKVGVLNLLNDQATYLVKCFLFIWQNYDVFFIKL